MVPVPGTVPRRRGNPVGGRGPGPLVASLAKDGVTWGARKVPVTLVPGDLTDEEIADLA